MTHLILRQLRLLGEAMLGGILIAALIMVPPLVALNKSEPIPEAAELAKAQVCDRPGEPVPDFCTNH